MQSSLTGVDSRPLARLATQVRRAVEINRLSEFSIDTVERAREKLALGQAEGLASRW